jgi:small-conductance mechanosensitive channel/CRP-like cAMP-binding protein
VEFWRTLGEHLWSSWTPVLILTYIITRALVRSWQVERYHMRAATTLMLGHLVAIVIGAALMTFGYDATIANVTALAFGLLAFLTLGMTGIFRVALPRFGFALPRILIDLLTAILVVVVFIIVGKRAGFSVAGIITTSAVLTAVIGLALQDTLGNVMGGLALQLDKSVRVGDWITLGKDSYVGQVTEIRWRYTAIETRGWETVIIPNGTLVKSQVVILGRRMGAPQMWRRHIDFFVDFRTPPTEVLAIVKAALVDPVERMAQEPEPQVIFFGVRDSFANYAVRYWLTDIGVDDPTDSLVRTRIWFALRRAGIPLSIPASTIFLTHETPEREERKLSRELSTRRNALASVDLFSALPEKLRDDLAGELEYTPFAPGESITREGDRDDGLYMIVRGEAVVRIGRQTEEREVARLGPGQFFGEMSLMTGEARTASVVAATELEAFRVAKPAFQKILRDTPALADQIAGVLASRRTALTAVRDERDDAGRGQVEHVKQDLLGKIRGFFGINSS